MTGLNMKEWRKISQPVLVVKCHIKVQLNLDLTNQIAHTEGHEEKKYGLILN